MRTDSLRVAHVVAHVSPDGRYGGPLRVAADLARAQRVAGHDSQLIATYEGYVGKPASYSGVRLTAFPAHRITGSGFAGLFSLRLVSHVLRIRRSVDVVHVHLARDALTSMIALALSVTRTKYVLQTHGMLEPKHDVVARLFDSVVVRRAARRAFAVMVLTENEKEHFTQLGVEQERLSVQPNGIHIDKAPHRARSQVLFLARLHPRKGAVMFAEAAVSLASTWQELTFTVAGPDEGDAEAVAAVLTAAGSPGNVRAVGPVDPDEVGVEMARSLVYVLPAEGEPFGLTILEALAQSTPVLIHETAKLADRVLQADSGHVFAGGARELASAIDSALSDRSKLLAQGVNGSNLAQEYALQGISEAVTAAYGVLPGEGRAVA